MNQQTCFDFKGLCIVDTKCINTVVKSSLTRED